MTGETTGCAAAPACLLLSHLPQHLEVLPVAQHQKPHTHMGKDEC